MYQATSNSNKVNGGNYSRLMLLPQSTTRNNRTFGNIPNASYVALFHNFDQGIDYLTFLVAFLHETRNTQFRTRNLRLNELICFFQWVDKNPQTHWHSESSNYGEDGLTCLCAYPEAFKDALNRTVSYVYI